MDQLLFIKKVDLRYVLLMYIIVYDKLRYSFENHRTSPFCLDHRYCILTTYPSLSTIDSTARVPRELLPNRGPKRRVSVMLKGSWHGIMWSGRGLLIFQHVQLFKRLTISNYTCSTCKHEIEHLKRCCFPLGFEKLPMTLPKSLK